MAGNTFNISGQVKQGAVLVTSGYVRVTNLNRPSSFSVVPIGTFEDGTLEAGRYDAWLRAQEGEMDVVAIGDIFELKVFNSLNDATSNINPLFAGQQTSAINTSSFNLSYLYYDLQLVPNMLPGLPVISSEDNQRHSNSRVVYWTWTVPSDPDNDTIHFQVEWSQSSNFLSGTTRLYSTLATLDRSLFSYETSPGTWSAFPADGISPMYYGKKCRIRITMSQDSAYYWRVRATDAIDR